MSSVLWRYRARDGCRSWGSYGGLESLEAMMRGCCGGGGHGEPLRVGHIESAFAKLCLVGRLLWWVLKLRRQLLLVMWCGRRGRTTARRRGRRI
jgi:hypothetical protein